MNEVIPFVLGAVLPPVIDLINKYISDAKWKYLVSVVICVVLAFILNLAGNDASNLGKLVEGSSAIFLSAQTIYKLYWKESDIRQSLK